MDRLEAMTILLAAVDTGSLSAASRHLRIPLATVSRRVAELEGHLHVRLLHRGHRKVVLPIGARSDQHIDYLGVIELSCHHQCGATAIIHSVNLRTSLEQQIDDAL